MMPSQFPELPTEPGHFNDEPMQQALRALLILAGINIPANSHVSSQNVYEAIAKLKARLDDSGASGHRFEFSSFADESTAVINDKPNRTVLIAGQLGIITHQLKQSLSKQGAEVTIVNDLFEAAIQYQHQDFRVVILDANMPNSDDGLYSLRDIIKSAHARQLQTHLIVLIHPSKDTTFQQRCKEIGATVVLPKDEGWQTFIFEYLKTLGFA